MLRVEMISWWATTWSNSVGRYFSTLKIEILLYWIIIFMEITKEGGFGHSI